MDCNHVADVAVEGLRVNADGALNRRKAGKTQSPRVCDSAAMTGRIPSRLHLMQAFRAFRRRRRPLPVPRLSPPSVGLSQSPPRWARLCLIPLA